MRAGVSTRLRVAFLTQYFPPEVGATQARLDGLTRGLAAAGIDVTVHTGFPNYPDGGVKAPYRNRPALRERRAGVRLLRSAVVPTPNDGFVPRMANQLGFAASALATGPLSGPQDVVVVQTPPLFTAVAAIPYARLKRAPLIAHVSDRWPATVVELGALRHPHGIAAAQALETAVYRSARYLTTPTEGLVRDLSGHPAGRGKVRRMPPVIDLGHAEPLPPPPRGQALRVLYAGTLGPAQGVGTLIDAAALAGPDVVHLTVAGGGSDADALRRRAAPMPNVDVVGVVDRPRVRDLFAAADVGAVTLRDRPVLHGALPTKLYECMAFGRPLVVSAAGEAARLVERVGCGVTAAPEDPAGLAAVLTALAESPAERLAALAAAGRGYAETHASLDSSVRRWVELLRHSAARWPPAGLPA